MQRAGGGRGRGRVGGRRQVQGRVQERAGNQVARERRQMELLTQRMHLVAEGDDAQIEYPRDRLAYPYIQRVKNAYAQNPQIYDEFLEILHRTSQVQTDEARRAAVIRIREMFHDRPDFVRMFYIFLPTGFVLPDEN